MINVTLSVLMELMSHDNVTTTYLAEKYEVSTRSVYRYVDSLSSVGVPIKKERGRGGGISIDKRFRVSYMFFTNEEMIAIKNGLNLLNDIESVEETVTTIKTKLDALYEAEKLSPMAIDNESLVINDNCWGDSPKLKSFISAIYRALFECKLLSFEYHGRNGEIQERVVEPHTFVLNNGVWYIYAYCRLRQAWRLFKLMRMTKLTVCEQSFERRKFDANWTLNFEKKAEEINLVLKVSEKCRPDVEEWVGVENVKKRTDGIFATITVRADDNLFSKLLSFGSGIRVVSPPAVINSYKKRVTEICRLYDKKP